MNFGAKFADKLRDQMERNRARMDVIDTVKEGITVVKPFLAELKRIGPKVKGEPLVIEIGRDAIRCNVIACLDAMRSLHDALASTGSCDPYHDLMQEMFSSVGVDPFDTAIFSAMNQVI